MFGGLILALLIFVTLSFQPGAVRVSQAAVNTLSLPWWTIDSGGGTSTGGSYTLSGTLGQFDASPEAASSGGVYSLTGGFWGTFETGILQTFDTFLPLISH